MADAELTEQVGVESQFALGKVRVQRPVRDQIEMVCLSLDQRLPANHFVRSVASAGSSSFKRKDTLQASLEAAQKRYEVLQKEREAAEDDPQSDDSDAKWVARNRAAEEKIDRG